jgi:hypothetical protein
MQHHAAITIRIAASTRKLAPIYAQNNTRTLDEDEKMRRCEDVKMRR